jgi:hypothetical protein
VTLLALLAVPLPLGAAVLAGYASRPLRPVPAAGRLAVVRAALLVGAYGAVSVEVLSTGNLLTPGWVVLVWLVALCVAAVAAGVRRRWDRANPDPPLGMVVAGRRLVDRFRALAGAERALVAVIVGLLGAELVLALASAPNTYDAQTYHLPKIEHWVAQRNVAFYAVNIHRQNTFPPGAEYLLLHLRLLTGGDALYGLVQWSAGVLCLLAVTRLVGQLGGGRRASLLAAFVLATTPLVVLESSSTQTDLIVAAWAACLATLVLDGVGVRPAGSTGPGTVVLLGVATGLIALTKQTGLLSAAPLLLWWGLARIRRAAAAGRPAAGLFAVAAAALLVLGLAGAMTGSYVWRMYSEYGHPFGPDYLRRSLIMQRHDPAAILVNAARCAHTVLDAPIPGLNRWSAHAVEAMSRAMGVDPQDPRITFDNSTFPTTAWYPSEDKAAFPVQAVLAALGVFAGLVRPGLRGSPASGARRVYATALLGTAVAHVTLLKWQPWGNRLVLYELVLVAPLAGLLLDRVLRPRSAATEQPFAATGLNRPRVRLALTIATVVALTVGASAGALAALYGWPRRLVGADSALVLDDWHSRFVERPQWADDYSVVGAAVRASGARRIGLVQGTDSWEYPWWLLLRGRQLVALQSNAPQHPPVPAGDVDAVICVLPVDVCQRYTPNWPVHMHGVASYALHP